LLHRGGHAAGAARKSHYRAGFAERRPIVANPIQWKKSVSLNTESHAH